MTFAQDIDGIVRASPAYDNRFFANCKDTSKSAHINDVAGMMLNWYLVTKHFGLSAPEYTALLARRLKCASGEKAKLLQHLLVESAMISGDDLGIGHDRLYAENGGAEIPHNERLHYKLWGNMTKTLIKKAEDIRYCVDVDELDELNIINAGETGLIHQSTYDLVDRIEDEFQSLEGGVAVYQTVESIAYNIVMAYSDLVQRVGSSEKPTFTERDLVYLEIHKPLEKDHDRQSTGMMDLADQYFGAGYRPVIETKVRELCRLFADFWKAMNEAVFREKCHPKKTRA